MRKLLKEINNFLSSTTIHGLTYISNSQTKCTRFIWTIVVLSTLGVVSYLLYQTIQGFETKYTSSDVETRSVQEFPFPAVTFHPGEYNSKEAFLRTFLNQFKFTRYDNPNSVNEEFIQLFKWLVSPMHKQLFDAIEKYLLQEKDFIKAKAGMFRDEVCNLLTLKTKKISLQRKIRDVFLENMYRYKGFIDVKNFLKKQISPIVLEAKSINNLTKAEISSICTDSKLRETKTKLEAMLFSFWFLFIDEKNTNLDAGDLATSHLQTGLSHDSNKNHEFQYYYLSTHSLLTNIFNNMTNAMMPKSVLQFPLFFAKPDRKRTLIAVTDDKATTVKSIMQIR